MLEVIKSFFVETPILLWLCVLAIGIAFECIIPNAQQLQSLSSYWLNFCHMVLYLLMVYIFLKPLTCFKDRIYENIDFKPLLNIQNFQMSGSYGLITTSLRNL